MRWSWLGLGMVVASACGARSGLEEFGLANEAQAGATVSAGGRAATATNPGGASASGAGAASGGSIPYEDNCVAFPSTLIDDFEDGRIDKALAPGLALHWWASFKQGKAVQLDAVKVTRGSSHVAMHARTNALSVSIGFRLGPCAHIGYPRAIAFWARASTFTGAFGLIESQGNTSVSVGGWCYSTLCSPASHWLVLSLTTEWQYFELPLDSFAPQPPGGFEAFRSFELFTGLAWEPGPIELWMDDPEFVR